MARESTIQILRSTSTDTPTGLTFGELAYSDVNGKLFVGRTGGASLWVGTGITTGSISTNSATLVPTQSAVKTYVDGVVGGGSVVNSVNGTAGAITITGDGGSQLVTVSGTTTTLSNRLASATVTGVASFGNEFVVTSGAVGLTSNYVKSFNGTTGAVSFAVPLASSSVTGVASFNATRFTVSGAGAVDLAAAFQVTGDTVVAGNAITATRSGNSVTVDNNGVRSVNGATGAVVSIATTGSNVFTGLNTFNAGISAAGATFTGTLMLGNPNSNSTIRTRDGSGSTLTISPYGSLILTPLSASGAVGSFTSLTIPNSGNAVGQVQINGGDLYLATKSSDGVTPLPVNIVFEGATVDANKTTLTVVDPTANRTISLPNASGTIALTDTTVASFNGSTGAVSFAVPLASSSVTGVASFNATRFTVSGAGAVDLAAAFQVTGDTVVAGNAITATRSGNSVTVDNNGVRSVNGLTGAVVSIAITGSNTFTGLQTMNAGLTANHLYVTNGATFASRIQGVGATFTGIVEIDTGLILPNGQNITSAVTTFNGASGAVSFAVPLASTSVTGVASFNSTRFTVSGAGAVDLAAAFQVTGDTVVAGNSITTTRSGNSVTVDNNGVRSFNGATGAITITGAGAITYTQSGTSNTINARIASTSLTGVAYFDSTNFTAAADGKVSITNSTITNAQLANSSISFAGGGSPSSVSLGGTLTITGTANEVKVTNSGSGTLTLGLPTDVVIGGNLTVNGTVITANVENFIVEDPLIALGTGNAADSVDLGWYGMYTSGSLRYAGTFRDASDGGKFKFFGGLTAQPSAIIDTSAATYATATIVANIDGGTF
jgi:hypothetical protein